MDWKLGTSIYSSDYPYVVPLTEDADRPHGCMACAKPICDITCRALYVLFLPNFQSTYLIALVLLMDWWR